MVEALDVLRAALADRYTIERELGRGGMAVVYLARDLKHDRQVALKVLAADVAEGVKTERFMREIQLAAKLTHPNILPLHDSGEAAGTLYYVMPFVEGESLRDRLKREHRLPVEQAVRITREVAAALSYAHTHAVVHRDIKPENILLQAGQAVVADFGIARALSAAQGQTVTQTGTMVGTPLYMSPEQAGGMAVDGRSDVYSLGCVLYEMLAGHAPFTGQTTQEVLARHMMDAVPSLQAARPNVPGPVERALTKALAKTPEDRFATAAEFAEALTAPSTEEREATARRAQPLRVAAMFGLAAVGVLSLVRLLVVQLGLPDWVFTGAIALLVGGLPVMLATGHLERRRALAGETSAPGGLRRWFTWRRALLGGAVAFGGLGVVTAVYMAMRLLGIGPVGTLLATGVLEKRDRILVADFENHTGDSTLGRSLTEAFRIDLAQSPVVRLLDGADIESGLQRMGRRAAVALDPVLARELGEREGAKALVAGEIAPLGKGFVLSARVLSIATGATLVALRQTASDEAGLIRAVDRLSKDVRARVGESLRTIRSNEPLERVTTSSLEALRRYSEANQAFVRGDYPRAIVLLQEAVALDTAFAMAYRKLGGALSNTRTSPAAVMAATRKAYQHRDRLPAVERYLTEGGYYSRVVGDREKEESAYRAVLAINPENEDALNLLSILNARFGRPAEAESLLVRALSIRRSAPFYGNLVLARVTQRKFAAAESTLIDWAHNLPSAARFVAAAGLAHARGDYASMGALYDSLVRGYPTPNYRAVAHRGRAAAALIEGRLAEAERELRGAITTEEQRNEPPLFFTSSLGLAALNSRTRGAPAKALAELERARHRYPLSALPIPDRPHLGLALAYAEAQRPDLARPALAEYDRDVKDTLRPASSDRALAGGVVALAEGRTTDAIVGLRQFLAGSRATPVAGLFELGLAFDRAGDADSAITFYLRFVHQPYGSTDLPYTAAFGGTHRRLGELYEARGDRAQAIEQYGKFVELWKKADPELQPQVRDVRARIARLAGER